MESDQVKSKAAPEELYRRIMRHLDLRGIPFEQAGRELGLTARQIEILKSEHSAPHGAGSGK